MITNQLKVIEMPKGKFREFILLHMTPTGWRLKKLTKEGLLQFKRDTQTGEMLVFPTKKAAVLLNTKSEFCELCIEDPQVKSMRHHSFLVEIAIEFRELGYSDYKINPMCPHWPERDIGADALLCVGQCRIAIILETSDIGNRSIQAYIEEFRDFELNKKFDGVIYFNENLETMRPVIEHAKVYDKILFVNLFEFLTKGEIAVASAPGIQAGNTVGDFLDAMKIITDLRKRLS